MTGAVYGKCWAVVYSCTTKAHTDSARAFIKLAVDRGELDRWTALDMRQYLNPIRYPNLFKGMRYDPKGASDIRSAGAVQTVAAAALSEGG